MLTTVTVNFLSGGRAGGDVGDVDVGEGRFLRSWWKLWSMDGVEREGRGRGHSWRHAI